MISLLPGVEDEWEAIHRRWKNTERGDDISAIIGSIGGAIFILLISTR